MRTKRGGPYLGNRRASHTSGRQGALLHPGADCSAPEGIRLSGERVITRVDSFHSTSPSSPLGRTPPNLRDLTHSAKTAVAGEQAMPAPAVPDLSRCSSCFPAALYPPLRPPKRTLLDGCPATPDNSLANKTGQVHLLPTQRTKAGRDATRTRGVRFGRPQKLNAEQKVLAQRLIAEGRAVREIATTFNVHPATIYRLSSLG